MTVEHSAIADTDAHEPKNVSTAGSGAVYVATGAGSGSWKRPPVVMTVRIADVSTSETVYIPAIITGEITRISSCISSTLTTASPTISVAINGVAVTNGSLVIDQGTAAAGIVDTTVPSGGNTISALTDYITVATDGASGTTCPTIVALYIEPTT